MSDAAKARYIIRHFKSSVELLVWLVIPAALVLRLQCLSIYDYEATRDLVRDYYWDMIIATLMVIFPIFFKQIFGGFPLEYLLKGRSASHSVVNVGRDYIAPSNMQNESASMRVKESQISSGAELIFNHAESSRSLAKNIYGRSGVYLLLGVLVAFSGLVFFYT